MSGASVPNAAAQDLPIEIVREILERAVHLHVEPLPRFTVDLQLLCQAARKWLAPLIYPVLVVTWPTSADRARKEHPSYRLFRMLLADPIHFIRQQVRHIVFITESPTNAPPIAWKPLEGVALSDWYLESVTLAQRQQVTLLRHTALVPACLVLLDPLSLGYGPELQAASRRKSYPAAQLVSPFLIPEVRLLHSIRGVAWFDMTEENTPTLNGLDMDVAFEALDARLERAKRMRASSKILEARFALRVASPRVIPSAVQLLSQLIKAPKLEIVLEFPRKSDSDIKHCEALCNALREKSLEQDELGWKIRVVPAGQFTPPSDGAGYIWHLRRGLNTRLRGQTLSDSM